MIFHLETPNAAYALRTLIIWAFLLLFNLLYAFLTKPKLRWTPLAAYTLSLLFLSLTLAMHTPTPNVPPNSTTEIVTYALILSLCLYGSTNLLLFAILPKWPLIYLTAFGAISATLSALFGYLCANDAKLYT